MRIMLILVGMLVIAGAEAAQAAPKREVKVERQSTGRDYTTPGTEFQNDLRQGWIPRRDQFDQHYRDYGNRFYGHRYYRQRPGLSLRYDNGDWSAEFNSGWRDRYQRHNYRSDYYLNGNGYLTDYYWVGDRPVYVYGDTYGIERRVITPRRNYSPLYTAPSYPEYGYIGGRDANTLYMYPDGSADANSHPQVYNDNRVYNYYYGDDAQPQAPQRNQAPPEVHAPQPAGTAVASPEAAALAYRASGQRFSETQRFETPDGTYMFALRDGAIYAGLADGKPTRLSDDADAGFGGYCAWMPGSGVCLFYRVGDQLCLAYPSGEDDRWVHEPLPYSVRFGPDTTIGLVGGMPWLTFSAADGGRYVIRYNGNGWEELGSGRTR